MLHREPREARGRHTNSDPLPVVSVEREGVRHSDSTTRADIDGILLDGTKPLEKPGENAFVEVENFGGGG